MNYFDVHDQFGRPERFDYRAHGIYPSGSFLMEEVGGWTYGDMLEVRALSGRTYVLSSKDFNRFVERWEKITSE